MRLQRTRVPGFVPLILAGKGRASNIQNELVGGGGGRACVEIEVAAERHGGRSDAERRNEGARELGLEGQVGGAAERRG
jgi:hypothetical protein